MSLAHYSGAYSMHRMHGTCKRSSRSCVHQRAPAAAAVLLDNEAAKLLAKAVYIL